MEQRANKFCYNLGKTATEASEMLVKVYGEGSREQKMCLRFHEGKESTEDEPRSCRPSASTPPEVIEKVRQ